MAATQTFRPSGLFRRCVTKYLQVTNEQHEIMLPSGLVQDRLNNTKNSIELKMFIDTDNTLISL